MSLAPTLVSTYYDYRLNFVLDNIEFVIDDIQSRIWETEHRHVELWEQFEHIINDEISAIGATMTQYQVYGDITVTVEADGTQQEDIENALNIATMKIFNKLKAYKEVKKLL